MAKEPKGEIRRVTLEPLDDGTFVLEVEHRTEEKKNDTPTVGSYDDRFVKMSFANIKQVADHLTECFPPPTSTTHKGKGKTSESGGSRMDTYEAEEAGEE